MRTHVVVLVLLGVFPFCVGLRMVNGTLSPYTNWRTLATYATLGPAVYFSVLLIVALLQDAADANSERAGNLVFGGTIGWQLFLFSAVGFFVGLDILSYRQSGQITTTDIAFAAVMVLLAFYCWPRTIEFSSGALMQARMLGGVKSIPLSDVADAKFDPWQRCIIITGKNGVKIVHSMFHARRAQFGRQIVKLTGIAPRLSKGSSYRL